MSLASFADLNEMHKSFLQEIGNMGAANAATEVSNMLSSPTDISTPQVRINPAMVAGKAADMLSAKAQAFLIDLSGDMKGSLLFVFPYPAIERMVSPFFPDANIKDKGDLDEMTLSATRETVNIAAASYANNMALMSGMLVDISVPKSVDVPSQEIEAVKNAAGAQVCSVKNSIEFVDCHNSFDVLFYPEIGSICSFMQTVGLEV